MTRRPDRRTRAATAATAGVLLATLTACNATGEAAGPPSGAPTTAPPASNPTTATVSGAPTPTATTSPTREEQAIAQAEQAVRDYYRVTDQLGADPNRVQEPLTLLKTVATGTGLNDARNEVVADKSEKVRQIGRTEIASMRVSKVDLSKKQPGVLIDVCYDVSKVNVVDENGKSIVDPKRRDRAMERVQVANYEWPDPQGWKVAWTEAKGKPCPGLS